MDPVGLRLCLESLSALLCTRLRTSPWMSTSTILFLFLFDGYPLTVRQNSLETLV